jgi:hypothetical protein
MPRGRTKGFHHSEETKAKMRKKRKEGIEEDLDIDKNGNPEPIEVPAI